MVPHGDRGDAAESRGVEHDERVTVATHDVVRVLVLDDHLEYLVAAPQDVLERLDADETQLTRHAPGYRDERDLRYDTVVRLAALFVISLLAGGCTRDPAEAVCPEISEGDLVVTEIGGPQTGTESLREFVEIYNASGRAVDLYGVKVRFRRRDGSSEIDILVRRSVPTQAGSYTVLGRDDDLARADYIDYGFGPDFSETWLGAAAVDVEACGVQIDRAIYDSLPRVGTYSLETTPPTGEANDLPANWCTDARMNTGSFPGSPQQANVACP